MHGVKVLGITGRTRDAAAALAVDGRVVSAATEDSFARVPGIGYALTGGFPHAAAKACLEAAGVESRDLDELVLVDDDGGDVPFEGVPVRSIDPVFADAMQAALSDPASGAVVVCGANPPVLAAFARRDGGLGPRIDVPGADSLVDAARGLATALGLDPQDPFATLDRLGVGAEPEFQTELAAALRSDGTAVDVESSMLLREARRVAGEHAAGLSDVSSLNARVQRTRRALAASFTTTLAHVVSRVAERAGQGHRSGSVSVGGSVFGNGRFNTELARQTRQALSFAPVPEASGRALGAAGAVPNGSQAALSLGPAFSEEDIKRTLDNCRLDYVYEPDWMRLLTRVSRMLAQGKIVAWFQGAMAFGPRALGTRSILGDPSNKYARQNLNEHLRGLPLDEPLPVVVAPGVADRFFGTASPGRGVFDFEVSSEWRPSLTSAIDSRHAVRVHGAGLGQASRLGDLLDLHFTATGTPALIETNLAGPGEPVACTPRDAVRTVYSSAIDALVIGRFLLMKDYWLLRSQE